MKPSIYEERESICPQCHQVLAANLIAEERGVYLEKSCPYHGTYRSRIASDYEWLSSLQSYSAYQVFPKTRQTKVIDGCPADCGECPEHRQIAAFFLFEITDTCNLDCPICLGKPRHPGYFISSTEMESMVNSILSYVGPGQITTIGGGEPTIHPQFFELVNILKRNGFEDIWVYTNGRRIAREPDFAQRLAEEDLYVVLQWDGFSDSIYETLRGRALLDEKKRALEAILQSGGRFGICPTIAAGVNDHELGNLYQMFLDEPALGTLDIAAMAYVGQGAGFQNGNQSRITTQDILIFLEKQSQGYIRASDFSPVSFSHPECLQIAYLLPVPGGDFIPLKRFLVTNDYQDLILNKPLLVLDAGLEKPFRDLVNKLWSSGNNDPDTLAGLKAIRHIIDTLFPKDGPLPPEELNDRSRDLVKVILVHSYMDGQNFDLARAKNCISRTMLPDGRMMPTCAYNVVHRK
jgi:uncharacterized radical SAM superfamily Fe-S cluster-containing enzyme